MLFKPITPSKRAIAYGTALRAIALQYPRGNRSDGYFPKLVLRSDFVSTLSTPLAKSLKPYIFR
ncbi:MAG: hypothetical protein ACSI46_12950 [Gloeotrichia echinulata DVL01]